jgi:hypothetical protein
VTGRRSARVGVALLLLVAFPAAALATRPRVERAQRAYDELRFEDVLTEVQAARRAGDLEREDEVELYRLEAYAYAVFDDEAHAVSAFRRLLALDPAFELPPATSPKIRRYFARAREAGPALDLGGRDGRGADRPFWGSGWFWGAVIGAAAIGVGAGLLFVRDSPGRPTGNLGSVDLP